MQAQVEAKPVLFTDFIATSADEMPIYTAVPDDEALRTLLAAKMNECGLCSDEKAVRQCYLCSLECSAAAGTTSLMWPWT